MYPLLTNEFCKLQIGPEEQSQFKEVKNQSFWNVKTVSSGELFCFHMTDSLCIVTNRTLISWTIFLLLITGPDSTPLVVGILAVLLRLFKRLYLIPSFSMPCCVQITIQQSIFGVIWSGVRYQAKSRETQLFILD